MHIGSKSVLVLALGCLLATGIAACGGDGTTGSSSTAKVGSSDPPDISGTVKVWDYEYGSLPGYTKAMKKLDAEFEALHPDVKVEREPQPFQNYEALVRSSFAAHEGPDVMIQTPGEAGVLSFTEGLEPLNELISPELQEELSLWEMSTPGFVKDGPRYGVPFGLFAYQFYYNKKMFAEAGLPAKFQPETWADVREAGEKLKAAGFQPFAGGNKEGYENALWFTFGVYTENTPQQTEELARQELPYTDEAIAKAFGPEFEMEEAGLFPADRFSVLNNEGFARFAEGEGAMVFGFTSGVGYYDEFNEGLGEKNVGVFYPPEPKNSPLPVQSAFEFSIPKFAKNKDAAVALLEFDASKDALQALVDTGAFMPNREDVSLPANAPIQAHEILNEIRERGAQTEAAIMVPSAVLFGPMGTEVSQALQGRISMEEAQEAMQETAEKTE